VIRLLSFTYALTCFFPAKDMNELPIHTRLERRIT